MLQNISVLGKWSLLIALILTIYGMVFLSEEEEEEINLPDWIKDDSIFDD